VLRIYEWKGYKAAFGIRNHVLLGDLRLGTIVRHRLPVQIYVYKKAIDIPITNLIDI